MASISQYHDIVKQIKDRFKQLTRHSYLQTYIAEPKVDEDQIRFLYVMLKERMSFKDAQSLTLCVLLVNAAFEVHEEVTLDEITSDTVRKERQLAVLAGDYYSSLYYYILAKNNLLPLVKVVSRSIQEINEFKMTVYESDELTYQEVERNIGKSESILLQNIADYFEMSKLNCVMSDFFYLKRLLVDKVEWLKEQKASPIVKSIIRDNRKDEAVHDYIESKIEELKDRILTRSKDLIKLERFIVMHVDDLIARTSIERVAEKG